MHLVIKGGQANMICKVKKAVFLLLFFVYGLPLASQNIALKNNVLYDLTTTLNFGVEARFAPQWTAEISGNYNPFAFRENTKWKHWMVQPEVRYWFCESFNRHFVGFHLMGGVFNMGNIDVPIVLVPTEKGRRYEGEMFGAGLSYGFHHILTPRLSLEYTVGLGWLHSEYKKYQCPRCGSLLETGSKDAFGLTKAAVSVVYMLDLSKKK